jgi:hypothetical protein
MSSKIGERMFLDIAALMPNKDLNASVESLFER